MEHKIFFQITASWTWKEKQTNRRLLSFSVSRLFIAAMDYSQVKL
jgi:hypothetical protein